MSDRYIDFANSSIGHRLVGALGLPSPVRLERWQAGRLRPIEGALLIGGGPLAENVSAFANRLTDAIYSYATDPSLATAWIPGHGPKLKAVVFDATHLVQTDQLKQLREFFQPLMKNLDHCAHLVILGREPQTLSDPFAASAQRAIEGFSRSLAKELRSGGTLQLIHVGEGAEDQLEGPLRFFLSPKSAFVSGQVIRLNACDTPVTDWTRPLSGRKALVTGAARALVLPSPKPWPATAPTSFCSTCHPPKPISTPSPHAWAGAASPSTSAPKTPPRNWSKRYPTASISWCTTPASPATKPWPT